MKKMISMIMTIVMVFVVTIPAFATDSRMLVIELDDGIVVRTSYSEDEFYVEKYTKDGWYVADIYDLEGNIVETFSLEILKPGMTRAVSTIQRNFTNTVYEKVVKSGLSHNICSITNEVLLEIYVNGSFKQIQSVISNGVHASDGLSNFTISSETCSALPPNGFPAAYVNCYYRATCTVMATNDVVVSGNVDVNIKDIVNIGFSLSKSEGSTTYYNKTLSNSWSISVT